MAKEIELKLALSPREANRLSGHPLLAGAPERRQLLNTYYDTPDLSLKRRRVALRFRKTGGQWLLTVKSAEPASGGLALRSEWEYPAIPGVFDFSPVDAPGLRQDLEAAIPRLEPIFTTDFRRTAWTVACGDSLLEVALDRGHIASQGRRAPLCELELELLSGQVADLFVFTRSLQEQFHLHPAIASKAERGYALFANLAPAPSKARLPAISPETPPVEAFRCITFGCLEHLQRNEAAIRQGGTDPEFIHQARVALRRLRSALRLFSPALPPSLAARFDLDWKELAACLGTVRNWDVFLAETLPPLLEAFPEDEPLRRLRREASRQATRARKEAAARLGRPEYSRLLTEFSAALLDLPEPADTTLPELAARRLESRARKARRLARRHGELDAAERHEMRIRFKQLRYALQFFAPLLPRRRLQPYQDDLARLQNELGLINDHVTAQNLLAEARGNGRTGLAPGWIAGRHALLLERLPEALELWLSREAPWKTS